MPQVERQHGTRGRQGHRGSMPGWQVTHSLPGCARQRCRQGQLQRGRCPATERQWPAWEERGKKAMGGGTAVALGSISSCRAPICGIHSKHCLCVHCCCQWGGSPPVLLGWAGH
jgi:hypothetical protein